MKKLAPVFVVIAVLALVAGCSSRRSRKGLYGDSSMYGDPLIIAPWAGHSSYMMTPVESGERYEKIEETGFKSVKEYPLSSFAIDVDTASYANMRRFINDGTLPPPAAVRIEEMINYFSYDYKVPEGDMPFSINMELAECPWDDGHQLAMVGIQGLAPDLRELPRNNLVFLLDVSGSMDAPDKLPLLKKSLRLLTDNLRKNDRVSIVVYAGAAGVRLKPTSNKKKILEAVEELDAGGSTAGGAGILLAYKLAEDNFMKKGNNRVILATDGDFNVGTSSDEDLVRLIEKKRELGIYLTVLGFGTGNLQDAKMEKLADKGNGNYAYIDNLLEAKKVLVNEMGGTLHTIAKDVKIQVEFNPAEVKGYRLIGYENRRLAPEDFDDDKKDAGELGAGHSVTALYELIPAGSDEKVPTYGTLRYQQSAVVESGDLMTVKLRYKAPKGDESRLIETSVAPDVAVKGGASGNIEFAGAVAEFGLLLRDSEFKGDAGYGRIIATSKAHKGADEEGYRAEFIRLVEMAQLIDKRNEK